VTAPRCVGVQLDPYDAHVPHHHRASLIAALALALAGAGSSSASDIAGRDQIIAAGDPTGLGGGWALVKSAPDVWLLHYLPSAGAPGIVVRAATLPQRPDSMAASGTRLVMVFAPIPGVSPTARSVRQVREVRASAHNSSRIAGFSSPASLAPLPGEGVLEGLAVERSAVFALLRDSDGAVESTGLRLLMLEEPNAWRDCSLPQALDARRPAWLAGLEQGIVVSQPSGNQLSVWQRDDSQPLAPWRQAKVYWFAGAHSPLGLGNALAAVGESGDSEAAIHLLRESGAVAFARIPRQPRMAIVACGSSITALWPEGSGPFPLACRVVSPGGMTVYEGRVRMVGPVSRRDLEFLALAVFAIVGTTVAYVLGGAGNRKESAVIPEGCSLAEPWRRLVAGALDLGLGVAVAAVLAGTETGINLGLAEGSVFTSPRALALIVAIVFLEGTLGEGLWGRSLGKAMTRSRVVSLGGASLTWRQVFLRNLVKVLCPPLAMTRISPAASTGAMASFGTAVVIRFPDAGDGETDGN